MKKQAFLLFVIVFFGYCKQKSGKIDFQEKTAASDTTLLSPKGMNVLNFLNLVIIKENVVKGIPILTMKNDFPSNWITRSDVDTLMKLLRSRQKCKCYADPQSSYLPINDSADLGGYALRLVEAYKKHQKFGLGLYGCPKIDHKRADELLKWWNTINYKESRR